MKKIAESHDASYTIDGKVYSAFQRDEIVTLWKDRKGGLAITVRPNGTKEVKPQREIVKIIKNSLRGLRWKKH